MVETHLPWTNRFLVLDNADSLPIVATTLSFLAPSLAQRSTSVRAILIRPSNVWTRTKTSLVIA